MSITARASRFLVHFVARFFASPDATFYGGLCNPSPGELAVVFDKCIELE